MEIEAGTNPFDLFQSWFDEAAAAERARRGRISVNGGGGGGDLRARHGAVGGERADRAGGVHVRVVVIVSSFNFLKVFTSTCTRSGR